MPRRSLSRRTIGVLAAALLIAAAAAPSPRAPVGPGVAEGASPLPPTPKGALLARMRFVLPRLVLTGAEARTLDFRIRSNTFDNRYPPEPAATFRWPLPGQTPNSPMMTEFFAGGFILGKAENLEGNSKPGNVAIVVWAFSRPEGAFRSLRALRDLSGLHSSPSSFAPGAVLLSLPGTGVSDLIWVRGRALVRASSGVAQGGASMAQARERVARAIDAKISADPFIGGVAPRPLRTSIWRRSPGGSARCGSPRTTCPAVSTPCRGWCGRVPMRMTACTRARPRSGSRGASARSACAAARPR